MRVVGATAIVVDGRTETTGDLEVPGDDGVSRVVEVGLRREAVEREEKATAEASRSTASNSAEVR